jgi:thioredoxin reductase (NADPH)
MESAADVGKPVLLAVDDEPEVLARIRDELTRRYAADYRVVCASSTAEACAELEAIGKAGGEVAVVLADLWMRDEDGMECLTHAQALHPGAKRALLVDWGAWADRDTADAILRAVAHGHIDYYMLKPWRSPDELFHRTVSEFIHEWSRSEEMGPRELAIVGERWSPRASELRSLLTRNGVPHVFHEHDSSEGARLLEQEGMDVAGGPVVVVRGGRTLVDPSNTELAQAYGVSTVPPAEREFDLIVIGAGPAGLATAVSASSEGLHTLVVERESIGGQAGASSRIRNYLGFSRGVSGADLAQRAYQQAWVFGTEFVHMREVTALAPKGRMRIVSLGDQDVSGRAVVLATGVTYRQLDIPALEPLVGRGVYYGPSTAEARGLAGAPVHIVGGGNSAGQAAMQLSRYAARVTLLVLEPDLAETMSHYLRREIEAAGNIDVRLGVEVVGAAGEQRLEGLTVRELESGNTEEVNTEGLFVLIGASPRTAWLPPEVARGEHGYVLTGSDIAAGGDRIPMPFETSLPGVFAVGDVRQGSARRVAPAVGEGAVVVQQVDRWLVTG